MNVLSCFFYSGIQYLHIKLLLFSNQQLFRFETINICNPLSLEGHGSFLGCEILMLSSHPEGPWPDGSSRNNQCIIQTCSLYSFIYFTVIYPIFPTNYVLHNFANIVNRQCKLCRVYISKTHIISAKKHLFSVYVCHVLRVCI